MERYYKKKRQGENSSSTNEPVIEPTVVNLPRVEVELDLNEIVADPGLRKSVEEFDVALRDRSSVSKDAAFCLWCYLFKHSDKGGRYAEDAFTKTGFVNWKRALEKFAEHVGDVNSCHNNARIQVEAFKDQRHSVPNMYRSNAREMDIAYRVRLTASLDVTRFLLKQGLPFRGHDESTSSSNRVDEARDVSMKEQMGVVLRYVNDEGYVVERFIGIVHVVDTCSQSLKDAIDGLFGKHGLSLSKLRGQGYDGASNMRGEFNGLKALVLKENPYAAYVHCFSHQLQLVIVSVAKSIMAVKDFFSYVSMIVNTTSASCKRKDQLRAFEHDRMVKELNDGEGIHGRGQNQETSLARPGDTRWGSHYFTLLRLCSMWASVEKVLENVRDDTPCSDMRSTTRGLLGKLNNYEFVFVLHLMRYLLGITNELSFALQKKDQNIVQAISLIKSVKLQLQCFRENGWDIILDQSNRFCEVNAIPLIHMEDTIARPGYKRQTITNYYYYHVEIFNEVVDLTMQEMNSRFSEGSTDLLRCMACLDPRDSFSQFDVDQLMCFTTLYPEDFSTSDCLCLQSQLCTFIANVHSDSRFSTISDLGSLAREMVKNGNHDVFQLVYRMINLALVLHVAIASVERAFSAMKIIKTDLRNRMQDEWMNDNLLVYIENDIFSKIDNEKILQCFQSMHTHRFELSPLS